MSVFDTYRSKAYPYEYSGALRIACIAGGVPSDQRTIEGWLRSKIAETDDRIRAMIAEVMIDRRVDAEQAINELASREHLNGFKRNGAGLYIEGRQLKEAGSIAVAAGKLPGGRVWGKTNKGIHSFLAEHVVVVEDELPLGASEPTGIAERFVHTHRGDAIQREEYVENAHITFTVLTDIELTEEQWAMIWLTGQEQGIGAARSQGFGRYEVIRWECQ